MKRPVSVSSIARDGADLFRTLLRQAWRLLASGLARLFHPGPADARTLHGISRARIAFVAAGALLLFSLVLWRVFVVATGEDIAGASRHHPSRAIASRADIVDRNGIALATNIETHSLYAHPHQLLDRERTIRELVAIFPDLDVARLEKLLSPPRRFAWIRKSVSPEQMRQVLRIGEPGLFFGRREMRFYPNGPLAAHVLGGYSFGREGVRGAEIKGIAGVEGGLDGRLNGEASPLRLSIDVPVQTAVEEALAGGVRMMRARGGAAVVMEVATGRIRALASWPSFDPNNRPAPPTSGDPADTPLFNRAVQGVYELGSVFKTLTIAQAIDSRKVSASTMIDTRGPLRIGRFRIRDFHDYGPALSVHDVLVHSSNIGTARIAQMIGPEAQRDFLERLGLFDPVDVELLEARRARPLVPSRWSSISSATVSYGHGISVSPLHIAAAYATVLGDGRRVYPTILEDRPPTPGEAIVGPETVSTMRRMLRDVVRDGTASLARNTGYEIGGKTGTADKVRPTGGYYDDRVIATFVAAVPASSPSHIIVVMLDEPEDHTLGRPKRTAGWTAVPVLAEMTRRIGPLLHLPVAGDEPTRQ